VNSGSLRKLVEIGSDANSSRAERPDFHFSNGYGSKYKNKVSLALLLVNSRKIYLKDLFFLQEKPLYLPGKKAGDQSRIVVQSRAFFKDY